MLKIPILFAISMTAALCSAAPSSVEPIACDRFRSKPVRGTITQTRNGFVALSDGLVLTSPYAAGDIAAAGTPLLGVNSLDTENRLIDLQGRLTDLNLKLLDERNKSIVNSATLNDYSARNGELSLEVRRRVTRQDELEVLRSNIAAIKENIRQLQRLKARSNGVFDAPVLLLSDPPRASETVKAGAPLFYFSFLDRLNVSVYIDQRQADAPERAFVALGKRCVPLRYVSSRIDSRSHSVELSYRGDVDRSLSVEFARLLRSPQPFVAVYFP